MLEDIENQRPEWIGEEKWEKLRKREKAFLVFWKRGWSDDKIMRVMFFNSHSGVRMMRKRLLGKIK